MRTMFEILDEYRGIIAELEEGKFTEELEDQLAINREDAAEKIESYYYVIESFKNKEDFLKQQIDRLNTKKKGYSKVQERLKDLVDQAMTLYGQLDMKSKATGFKTRKMELATVTASAVSYPTLKEESLRLISSPAEQLPSKYVNYTIVGSTIKEEDKIKIEEALKDTGLSIYFTTSIDSNLAKEALKAGEEIPVRDTEGNINGDREILGYMELQPNYKTRFK